jgi:hypothetical protein
MDGGEGLMDKYKNKLSIINDQLSMIKEKHNL